jgi:Txe/YoeB family toxin of Txe-Axe toxin-antitoxin module
MNLVFIKKIATNFIHSKKYFQFKIPLPVIINNKGQGETIIISEDFIKFNIFFGKSSDYPIGSINNVDLCLLSKTIKLNIEIVKLSYLNNKKILSIEAKIKYLSEIDKNSLNNCIYSANWHHDLFLNKRGVLISPIKQTIFKYITLGFFKPTVIKKWNSMYYFNNDVKNNNQRVAYISNTINKDGLRLIAVFEELELNEHITGYYSLKVKKENH